MSSNTINLSLLKEDPAVDGNNTFNIKTMLNDNWDKIDAASLANLLSAKGYTDTKVASIVNSSPATLDTLKELADALGDDPNYAATITALIGTKETPAGAQAKADAVQANLSSHLTENANFEATKGQVNGLASLGSDGKVSSSQITAPTVNDYASSGTWTKPAGATIVKIVCIGAGGGGGGGYASNAAGGGGGGGAYTEQFIKASELGTTETFIIGLGGTAGGNIGGAGRAGGAGGNSIFGSAGILTAYGGAGGGGVGGGGGGTCGNGISTTGGLPSVSTTINAIGGGGGQGSPSISSAGGCAEFGGAGGGYPAANGSNSTNGGSALRGGAGGGAGGYGGNSFSFGGIKSYSVYGFGSAGSNGADGNSLTCGAGGNGGAGVTSGTAGTGGNGGNYGGGGAGGGAYSGSVTCGRGGIGGNGRVIVYAW